MTRYEQEILATKRIRVVCESGLVPQLLRPEYLFWFKKVMAKV